MIALFAAANFFASPLFLVCLGIGAVALFLRKPAAQVEVSPKTKRAGRRIMTLPAEKQPPTQGQAFTALDVLLARMAVTGVPEAEQQRLHDELVPKLFAPKE